MLRRWIEKQEIRLHGRDNNRVSLPFEWGLEHVGLPPSPDPAADLCAYSDRAVARSHEFFHGSTCTSFSVEDNVLTFPSAIETPHAVNNTVWCRLYPGRDDRAVVVLPQWNARWTDDALCRVINRVGITVLRLVMPYHLQRKPADLQRAEYLVSPNIGRTLTAVRQAVMDARRCVDWLEAQGLRRVGIVGTSIGSCTAFLAFVHDARIKTGVFIHVSGYFADVVWHGISTSHVRDGIEQGTRDVDLLRRIWSPISPAPFVRQLQNDKRHFVMLAGRYDLSFPFHLTERSFEEFDRLGIAHHRRVLRCGHYTLGKMPFSAVAGYEVVQGIRRGLELSGS